MWGNPFTEWLPYMSSYVVVTGANLLIHSTIILSAGLLGAYALKEKGAAAQSIVLRVFLAAFLLCTPVSIILHKAGIGGLTITVPLTVPQKPTDNEFSLRVERKNVDTSNEPVKKLPDRRAKTGIETLQKEKTAVSSAKTHDRVPVRSQHTKITTAPDRKEYTPVRPEVRQTEIQNDNNLAVIYMLMAVVWTVLTLIVMTRLILNNLYLVYVRFTAVQAKQSFLDASKYAARKLNMRAPVVLQNASVKSPFAAGILQQYIILPLGKHETGLPEKEVFLHELAHLKRRDPLWNLLVRITRVIIPFQPLIWIYTRWIAVTNDYVCDDYVMNSIENHRSYASDLAHLARHYHPRGHEIEVGAGFISVKSSLRRRIARILDATRKLSLRVSARLVFNISLLCAFITFVTGFIGIKGKNNVQESFASEKKPAEKSEKISAKTHDTELPDRDTVVLSGRYDRPPVNDTPEEITEQPQNNVSETDTAVHEDSDLTHGPAETYSAAVIQHPHADDSDEVVEFPSVNTDTGQEPESSTGNETIEAAETSTEEFVTEIDKGEHEIANTVIINDSAASTITSFALHNNFEPTGSSSVSSGEIDNLALKTLDIVISYDFENADLTNPEEKLRYDMYRSLQNNKLYPVWSPDGNHIVITDRDFAIWMVPVMGGEPDLIYQNEPVSFHDVTIRLPGIEPLCFAPGGRILTYKRYIIDEDMGTEVI
ncbi:MAG TPA: M56 family metallopeptidase, partial [bacterium]|nr:M56 family metallopeptidase [bacterium]